MHLHSRRLRIDHPDGGAIDISAELPEPFAASIDALGFDLLLGDVGTDSGEKGPPPKPSLRAKAKAHSKQIRTAQRGERRGRKSGRASCRENAGTSVSTSVVVVSYKNKQNI